MKLEDRLRHTMHVKLMRYAAGRKMFCDCGKVLDYRRSVLVGSAILCAPCYDAIRNRAIAAKGLEHVEQFERQNAENSDFIDGRTL